MSTAEWGPCATCGREVVVKRNGTMRLHKGDMWWGGRRQLCEGTGKPPANDTALEPASEGADRG